MNRENVSGVSTSMRFSAIAVLAAFALLFAAGGAKAGGCAATSYKAGAAPAIPFVSPQGGAGQDFDELHGPVTQLAKTSAHGFTNDAESLFEAVEHTPVDFLGKTCGLANAIAGYDLSRFVLADKGFFDTRDEALKHFGTFYGTWRGRAFELLFGDRKSSC